jgi:hypothetical protein
MLKAETARVDNAPAMRRHEVEALCRALAKVLR